VYVLQRQMAVQTTHGSQPINKDEECINTIVISAHDILTPTIVQRTARREWFIWIRILLRARMFGVSEHQMPHRQASRFRPPEGFSLMSHPTFSSPKRFLESLTKISTRGKM
jgi:hypothetical protein